MKIKIRRGGRLRPQVSGIEAKALGAHREIRGKVELVGRVRLRSLEDLALFYTPGVAYASSAIRDDKDLTYAFTGKWNRIAIVTDGSRVLGLGDIGPNAALPVMEGKSLLFKRFGNVDALPMCINAETADEIVAFAKTITPSVAGINIEDIAAPKCFDVFDRLQKELEVPVFHDDRQGTAVVACAALRNALKLVGKELAGAKIVINGSGAAGIGITQLLLSLGATNIILCDRRGILYKGREDNMNPTKEAIVEYVNKDGLRGQLSDAVKGADALIGVSERGAFTQSMIRAMGPKPIVFALANPDPEISYEDAKAAGAAIVATGASNVPNQVNNLLAFPAVFRGALEVESRKINTAMLIAASDALSNGTMKKKLSPDHIIPNFVDGDMTEVTAAIAASVAKAAMDSGVARLKMNPDEIKKKIRGELKRYMKLEKTMAKLSDGKVSDYTR